MSGKTRQLNARKNEETAYGPRLRATLTAQNHHEELDATWVHNPNPAIGCPIKDRGAEKYALLKPVHTNHAAAAALRKSFLKNGELHWNIARTFAEFANIGAFSGFAHHADKTSLWGYFTLNEWQLRYTFSAT